MFIIFEGDRETEHEQGRSTKGDTESKVGSRLWAVSTEPDAGLKPTDREIMTWAEVGCSTDWATQAPPFWWMFCVHLKRMCALLFYNRMFWIYLLDPSGPVCHSKPPFPYWFCLDNLSIDVSKVIKSPIIISFFLLLTVLCIWLLPFGVHKYLLSLYVVGLSSLLLFLMFIYLFWEKEGSMGGGGTERDRLPSRLSSRSPTWGSVPWTVNHNLSQDQESLNRLSHPSSPVSFIII